MNQPFYSVGERRSLAFLGLFSLTVIGAALYLQFSRHADPCPLCILQRYAYLMIALFTLLGAAAQGVRVRKLTQILALIMSAGGIAAATRQLWLLAHPFFSCGFDALQPILDRLPPAKILPFAFKVEGLCESPSAPILGLSLPTWSLLGYLLIFTLVSYNLYKRNAQRKST